MERPREASENSILYHLNDILDRPFHYLGNADRLVQMRMAEEPVVEPLLNNNFDEAIELFQNVLNHPNADRLGIKKDIGDFIYALKEIKNDFNEGSLNKTQLSNLFTQDLIKDLEGYIAENAGKLQIEHRFNNVDKYEGFEEALREIGARRKTKRHRRKTRTRKRKTRRTKRRRRKTKKHRKRRK